MHCMIFTNTNHPFSFFNVIYCIERYWFGCLCEHITHYIQTSFHIYWHCWDVMCVFHVEWYCHHLYIWMYIFTLYTYNTHDTIKDSPIIHSVTLNTELNMKSKFGGICFPHIKCLIQFSTFNNKSLWRSYFVVFGVFFFSLYIFSTRQFQHTHTHTYTRGKERTSWIRERAKHMKPLLRKYLISFLTVYICFMFFFSAHVFMHRNITPNHWIVIL